MKRDLSHSRRAEALGLALLLTLLAPHAADAQRYGEWREPAQAGGGDMQSLIRELRTLVDEGERARAADRRFLADLRDLLERYDSPWSVPVLRDDFTDGDFTRGPAWVASGDGFRVERDYGLYAWPAQTSAPAADSRGGDSGRDLATAIIGGLLEQYARPQDGSAGGSGAPVPGQLATDASLSTSLTIPNAFELRARITTYREAGSIVIGVYQGYADGAGYRLALNPGAQPAVQLMRHGSRGSAVIETSAGAPSLADRRAHEVRWTRASSGVMSVSLDGTELFRVSDRGLRDPFNGVVLINRGAEFALREIEVTGAGPR